MWWELPLTIILWGIIGSALISIVWCIIEFARNWF